MSSWLVVGLGNPGPQYELTRHNVGHLTIGQLVDEHGGVLAGHKSIAQVADMRLGIMPGGAPGPQVRAALLNCYMNTSGGPLRQLVNFFHTPYDHLLVIHDDLDLPEHTIKLKRGGGEGGHNGLKSISQSLGSKDYARLRIGIGRPPGRMTPADYVLAPLRQLDQWAVTFSQAAQVIEDVATLGFVETQQRLHSK
ncbi:MAG: aminoacyl-tRNA hydrolase [Actinomycetaceae bacterium]|nr:aminoacyl-tRNA hydrolase [Actinomycetaceae bacterium]